MEADLDTHVIKPEPGIDETDLRLRDHIWRPWYARGVWLAAVVYWSGCISSLWLPSFTPLYQSMLGFCLYIFLFPPITMMILGASFFRAKLNQIDWHATSVGDEFCFPQLSRREFYDPNADPLDPRSGLLHWRHLGLTD